MTAMATVWLGILGGPVISAQDKAYTAKGGLRSPS